ncbi:MAG: hypothetical protein HYT61_03660 [Candidatus Yanofskybacteria bacterium]|nr:hypothetical protein [Candidatus Yanofskybacteria bacterium]
MKILNEKNFYQTSDFCLATVISLSFPIEAVDRQNTRKVQFIFRRNNVLDKLIEDFWRGEIRIDPQLFYNQLRVMKARIYND